MAAKKPTKNKPAKKAAKPAAKKPAAKKAPAKKAAPKAKPAAKKPVAKKPVAKAKPVAKKPVAKKVAPKAKPVAKKVAPKKPEPKAKVVAKKPEPKKEAPVKKEAPKVVAKAAVKKEAPKVVAKPVVQKPITARLEKAITPTVPKTPVVKKDPNDAKISVNKAISIPIYSKPKQPVFVEKAKKPTEVDTRTRYSDAELQEFREIINKKLDEARRDLELLRGSLSHTDDHGTDDTSPTFKMMEDGSETLSREETAQLAGRQEKFINALESALMRIENKTYGVCRVTGKLISKDRLRLVPHTTLSIEAKNLQN